MLSHRKKSISFKHATTFCILSLSHNMGICLQKKGSKSQNQHLLNPFFMCTHKYIRCCIMYQSTSQILQYLSSDIIHTHHRSFTGTRWSKCCYNWRNSEAKNVPSDWPQRNDRTAGNTEWHTEGQLLHALLRGVWYVHIFQQTIIIFQLLSN